MPRQIGFGEMCPLHTAEGLRERVVSISERSLVLL